MKSAKGVSLATVRKVWTDINERVFEGKLFEPYFRITRARSYWARCDLVDPRNDPKISIYVSGHFHQGMSTEHRLNALYDTLAHEMIHQWQFEQGLKYNDNHDETFTKWIPIIQEKLGITLQDSWSTC
jgi:hypothetical protein